MDWLTGFLKTELATYPGRTAKVARMVTACVVTMLLVMAFRLPNGFLAAFYAFAISRENPGSMLRNGLAIALANLTGLALALAGIVLLIDYPLLHFAYLVGIFFLAFFLVRTLANYSVAFGACIILVAASSVNIIWARPGGLLSGLLRPDVGITLWTSFGMILGTLVAVATDWALSPPAARVKPLSKPAALFVADAFSNPAHQVFALKGCVAATICYLTWAGLAWPGLGVCTVTCVIAAPLSTPGSSRQRLTTRLLGLLTGGVLCGIGSQVFLLPYFDSIAGFTLLFAAVSAAAAWVATSSPGLAYFGRQMALAYYLTMFQGWGADASLTASRDRLLGVLLGLLAMWFVYDAGEPRATARTRVFGRRNWGVKVYNRGQ